MLTRDDRDHLYETDRTEAEIFVRSGLAVQLAGSFTAFVRQIELTVTVAELREHVLGRVPAKHRPKPPMRAPQSSTGDAGRGLSPLIGHYRTLHFGPLTSAK